MRNTPTRSYPLWRRPVDAFVGSKMGAAIFSRVMPVFDPLLMKITRGRFSMTMGLPTLLLTTTGRKSGQPRSTPLIYVRRGADLAIIGTRFGSTKHPGWYYNLKGNPEATVLLKGEEFRVVSRDATTEEREEIWNRATQMYSGYEKYKKRVGSREIPILVLSRL